MSEFERDRLRELYERAIGYPSGHCNAVRGTEIANLIERHERQLDRIAEQDAEILRLKSALEQSRTAQRLLHRRTQLAECALADWNDIVSRCRRGEGGVVFVGGGLGRALLSHQFQEDCKTICCRDAEIARLRAAVHVWQSRAEGKTEQIDASLGSAATGEAT